MTENLTKEGLEMTNFLNLKILEMFHKYVDFFFNFLIQNM